MLAGDGRQPHLPLVMGWRVGVNVVVVVKGMRRRPEGEQRILYSSTQQPGDEPVGEDCVCRLEPGDETGAWKGLRVGWRGCRPGNASCQTVHHVQHMSLSTYCSSMQSPLHH